MNLGKISNAELDARLVRLARTERKITRYILWHVLEVMTRKLYLEMGYANIISYMIKHLGYCETSARNRVNSAELLMRAPAVVEKIESGDINLTQLTQVRRHIRQEEHLTGQEFSAAQTQDILQKIENQNSFETIQTLAVEFDRPLKLGVVLRPQKDGSVRVEMTFTAEQFADIQECQKNNAHDITDASLPDLMAHLARKDTRAKNGSIYSNTKPDGNRKLKKSKCVSKHDEPTLIDQNAQAIGFVDTQSVTEFLRSDDILSVRDTLSGNTALTFGDAVLNLGDTVNLKESLIVGGGPSDKIKSDTQENQKTWKNQKNLSRLKNESLRVQSKQRPYISISVRRAFA